MELEQSGWHWREVVYQEQGGGTPGIKVRIGGNSTDKGNCQRQGEEAEWDGYLHVACRYSTISGEATFTSDIRLKSKLMHNERGRKRMYLM